MTSLSTTVSGRKRFGLSIPGFPPLSWMRRPVRDAVHCFSASSLSLPPSLSLSLSLSLYPLALRRTTSI
eukprot:COSAG02_NODE_1856_length_10648_cov_8.834581_11_plen_69_part_00